MKSLKNSRLVQTIIKLSQKGAFDILVGNFMTKFLVFFGTVFLVRVLSKQSYGVLGFIENIYSYIFIFAGMGLNNAVLRYVLLSKDTSEEYGHYRYAFRKGNIFNLAVIFVVVVVGFLYPYPTEFSSARYLLPAIALALPFQYLVDLNLYTFRAKLANRIYAISIFLFSVILIGSKYFFALHWDLPGVIIAKVSISAFFGIFLSLFTYRRYFRGHEPYILNKEERKAEDIYSVQYMITNGIWVIFMLNDIFLLGALGSDAAAIADYKVAYVLPGNLSILSGAIGMFVAPYFVKNENNKAWVRKNYWLTMAVTCTIIGAAILVLFIFSSQLISLLFGEAYSNIDSIMRLLLISSFANSAVRVTTANLLAAMGQIRYNMVISISGIVLQILMNLFMIPAYGSVGVAITNIIVYTLMAAALLIIFTQKYKPSKPLQD